MPELKYGIRVEKKLRQAKVAIIISLVLIGIMFCIAIYFYLELIKNKNELQGAKERIAELLDQVANDYVPPEDTVTLEKIRKATHSSNEVIGNMTIGKTDAEKLIEETTGSRENIIIEVWGNEDKGKNIEELLKLLDYEVRWVDSRNDSPINSIWYSKSTSIKNVKLIAILMLNAGYDIKQIK